MSRKRAKVKCTPQPDPGDILTKTSTDSYYKHTTTSSYAHIATIRVDGGDPRWLVQALGGTGGLLVVAPSDEYEVYDTSHAPELVVCD